MAEDDLNQLMRKTAFERVKALTETYGHLTHHQLSKEFYFRGERIPIFHPQRGIHKPQQMQYLLSIKTGFVMPGKKVSYDDQRHALDQIFRGNKEVIDYSFMGTDPNDPPNQWLLEAKENRIPIIYFLGIARGCYLAEYPVYITDWNARELNAKVAFISSDQSGLIQPDESVQRRYGMYEVHRRLHQARFRERVMAAYSGRCAISNLPEERLLDAAHIIPDSDEKLGQPIVPNGLLLSKIHHAAFDSNLIGVDQDYRLHVSRRLRDQSDGPILQALKKVKDGKLRYPRLKKYRPDPDRLKERFKKFEEMA